jgi:hypothetical protein
LVIGYWASVIEARAAFFAVKCFVFELPRSSRKQSGSHAGGIRDMMRLGQPDWIMGTESSDCRQKRLPPLLRHRDLAFVPGDLLMKPIQFARFVVGLVGLTAMSAAVVACPFCSAPSMTLTEQLADADAAVLVKWIGGTPAKLTDAGSTEFEIVEVVHQPAVGKLDKGQKLNVVRFRSGKAGDLFLLLGTSGVGKVEWGSPLEVTQQGFDYMKNSPKPKEPPAKRLQYFLKYLENPDRMIGDDAYGEFANAAYADVVQLAPQLPREKLRQWLSTNTTSPGRLALYGMMLGLCGTEEDAKLLEHRIVDSGEDFRLGIDGIMGGYLLLTGERGLEVLEARKLKDKKAPFSETYAAMQALRFMWQHGDNRIDAGRMRQSMRILLERPELADLVIADLARMKDWSIMDRLMSMYDEEDYNIPSIKRSIVRFMLAATKDTGIKKGENPEVASTSSSGAEPVVELPVHVIQAEKCLADLEQRDPKTVREAKRFYTSK